MRLFVRGHYWTDIARLDNQYMVLAHIFCMENDDEKFVLDICKNASQDDCIIPIKN